MSIGPATPIVGTTVCQEGLETRKPFSLTSGGEAGALLFIFIPGPSHQTAVMYQCSSSFPVDPVTYQSYESPALKNDAPHDAIVTRASLRIRNWTQSVGRGGQVRVLRMTTGTALSGDMTNADLVEFQENMRVHTRTRTYGGDELAEAMQKNATVVDQSKAITFKPWDIAEAIPGYPFGGTGIPQSSKAQTLWEPAYTPIAILFEPFVAAVNGTTVGNKYEIDLRTQYLAHYKQGTMLANMAINPPIDGQAIEKHRAVEESSGSMLQKVGAAIQHAGQWAWDHRSAIATGARAAWHFGRQALPYAGRAAATIPMIAV
jgi:hypothetical protein